MKLIKAASLIAISALLVSGAFAQGKKPAAKPAPAAKAAAKAATCPVCKMPLMAKASKMNPVAVKYHGKVMYCCSQCKMLPNMLVKPGTMKAAAKKPMAKKPMAKAKGK